MARSIESFKLKTDIVVDGAQMHRELIRVEKQVKSFTGAFKGGLGLVSKEGTEGIDKIQRLGSVIGGLAGPASIAVGALSAVGASIFGVGAAIFALVEKASEFGSAIHDISQQTGLGAETLSSLKFAADQSSSSIEEVSKGMKKFSITVAEAARGSEEARAKLMRLGVEPKAAVLDLDKALGRALSSIAKAPPGILRTERAADAFGSKLGASLIPIILSFDGNLEDLVRQVKKIGGTLDDAQADDLDKFGDALDTIKKQAAGLGNQFASALAPEITRAMGDISLAIGDNGAAFRQWGHDLGDAISGISAFVNSDEFQQLYGLFKFAAMTPLGLNRGIGDRLRQEQPAEDVYGPGGVMRGGRKSLPGTREYKERAALLAGLADMEDEARKKAAKSAKSISDPLAAFKRIAESSALAVRFWGQETEEAKTKQALLAAGFDKLNAALKPQALLWADIALKNAQVLDSNKEAAENEAKIQKELEVAAQARNAFNERQLEVARELRLGAKTHLDLIDDEIAALDKLHAALTPNELTSARQLAIAQDFKADAEALDESLAPLVETLGELSAAASDFETQFAAAMAKVNEEMGPPPEQQLDPWKQTFSQLKDVGMDALGALAGGIGDMAAQWVLLGDQADVSMQKLVASVLAGVTAQAATLAIMETAYGIAALTPWGALTFGPAPLHFQAAALFAAVAAGAGVLGRVTAGDSLNEKAKPRAMGGPVRRGESYIVGERRPELFVPGSDGWIHPRVGAQSGGGSTVEVAALAEAVRLLTSRISSMRPGEVVTAGAHGFMEAMDRDAQIILKLGRRLRLP
jgi:hypothetical protein